MGFVSAQPTSLRENSTFLETFEERCAWHVGLPQNVPVTFHNNLAPADRPTGATAGLLRMVAASHVPDLRAEHKLPPALRIDDVSATLWVRSTCPNVRLLLKLVFPHQIDPRTGKLLEADLLGDRYTQLERWQQLSCATTDIALEGLIVRLRAQLSEASTPITIDAREVFISHAVLLFDAVPGNTYLFTDDLQLSPVISPPPEVLQMLPIERQKPRLHFNDRVLLDDRPFFPLFTTYHAEPIPLIQDSAVNMVWIEDYTDQALLESLQAAQIGVLAQPPRVSREEDQLGKQALVPLAADTAPVWAWMLGKQIPESELHYISNWSTAIRDADRSLPRPLLAEVLGLERQFHRSVSMLGASEHTVHSAIDPLDATNRLEARQDAALPGKPMFTFIATEPADARIDAIPTGGNLPILEPEQILLQGYSALAAGYRGLGYSKRYSFEDQSPGLNERLLAIKLLNLHIRLLEPWLATGRLLYHLDARVGQDDWHRQERRISRTPFASRWDTVVVKPASGTESLPSEPAASQGLPVRASVFQTDYGHLILLVAYQPNAQFVPGEGQAENVRILIKGDAVQGWEVGPTEVGTSNLEMTHEAGGTALHLKKFDQFAAIVITRDGQLIDNLKRNLGTTRRAAAEAALKLAELKLSRITDIQQQLVNLKAPAVPEATRWLMAAEQFLARARQDLGAGHDHDAFTSCQKSLGLLRRLQRAHWENALAALPSPMTSPYCCSFQTLPDHWRLLMNLSQHPATSANLLPSGDFENHAELIASWGSKSSPRALAAGMEPRVELIQESIEGRHALAISLPAPTSGLAALKNDIPLSLESPEIPHRAGEILYISGRIKLPQELDAVAGGVAIYDSLLGPTAAVRYAKQSTSWERFSLIRETPVDGVLRIYFDMHSPGTVILDDVQVKTLSRE